MPISPGLLKTAAADIIQGHPALSRVLIFRRKQWLKNIRSFKDLGRTLADIRAFLGTLRDRHYDLVIDFHGLFKSAIVVGLSGGRRKLGYDSPSGIERALFYNEKIPEDMTKHAVDRYLDFIRYLGGDSPELAPENLQFFIAIGPENVEKIRALLSDNGIGDPPRFIAVSPTAFWPTKMWEDDKFAALCDRARSGNGPAGSPDRRCERSGGQGHPFQDEGKGNRPERQDVPERSCAVVSPGRGRCHDRFRTDASGSGRPDAGGGPLWPDIARTHRSLRDRTYRYSCGYLVQPVFSQAVRFTGLHATYFSGCCVSGSAVQVNAERELKEKEMKLKIFAFKLFPAICVIFLLASFANAGSDRSKYQSDLVQ